MYKTITPETARNAFYSAYEYEQISGNKLRTTAKDSPEDLRLVFPTSVPLGENGRPFAPGDAFTELAHHHALFQELQLDPAHVIEVTVSTGLFRYNENDEPEFEFVNPADVGGVDLLIMVNWRGDYPPVMSGLGCDFARRFSAKFFRRAISEDRRGLRTELLASGVDLWIVPKHDIFIEVCSHISREIRQNIAAGDVYAATAHQVKPIYRDYMENILYPCLQAICADYSAEFGDDYVKVFRSYPALDSSGNLIPGEGGKAQLGCFCYTLSDAQKFALLASTRAVTQTHPAAGSAD